VYASIIPVGNRNSDVPPSNCRLGWASLLHCLFDMLVAARRFAAFVRLDGGNWLQLPESLKSMMCGFVTWVDRRPKNFADDDRVFSLRFSAVFLPTVCVDVGARPSPHLPPGDPVVLAGNNERAKSRKRILSGEEAETKRWKVVNSSLRSTNPKRCICCSKASNVISWGTSPQENMAESWDLYSL